MKRKYLLVFSLLLVLSIVLTTSATASQSSSTDLPTYNLRLSSEYPADNHQTVALLDAARIIKEKTDSHVNITVYPALQLGDYTVVYGQVMSGDIDIAACPIASSYDQRIEFLSMPYLVSDFDEFKREYFPGSYVWETLSEINSDLGCTLLGIFNAGFMGIGLTKLPFEEENFAKLTDGTVSKSTLIRIPPINIFRYIIEDMGYRTTTIPYADLYGALQSGVASGWIGGSALVNWEGFRDVIKYFIDCRAVNECIPVMMNTELLQGMPNDWQQIIRDTFIDISTRIADERNLQEEKAMVDMEDYGIKVIKPTDEEIAALKNRIRANIWPKTEDVVGEEIYNDLNQAYIK